MRVRERLQAQIDAHEREHAEESERFRRFSLDERGRLVRVAWLPHVTKAGSLPGYRREFAKSGLPPRGRS